MRRIGELGEFALIARIARAVRAAGRAAPARGVVLGIGDDAALLRPAPREDVAVSTDAAVEGVHFRFEWEDAASIGRRAMVAALSDLAAMGARPLGVVAALAAPASLEVRHVDGLVRGLLAAARRYEAPLVGGNWTRGRDVALTLTALGGVARGRALRRDGARPGDRILVTGTLGRAALALARRRRGLQRAATGLASAPEPRLAAGRALAGLAAAGACIDVSDGLVADLGHLLEASRVGARLDPGRVPRAPGFDRACTRLGVDPLRLALAGGEDYELLFTVRPGAPGAEVLARRLGVAVTEIGSITRGRGLRGVPAPLAGGFTHF